MNICKNEARIEFGRNQAITTVIIGTYDDAGYQLVSRFPVLKYVTGEIHHGSGRFRQLLMLHIDSLWDKNGQIPMQAGDFGR